MTAECIPMMRNINEFYNVLKKFIQPRNPFFVLSVISNPKGLAMNSAKGRIRTMEARMLSILVHTGLLSFALLMVHQTDKVLPDKNAVVFLNTQMASPWEGDDAGGGGGGKNQPEPAATGFMPDATRVQMMPPDPDPSPLLPAEDLIALLPSVQMPIEILQTESLPIGVVAGTPNGSSSSGLGTGDGIGNGVGPGIGPGIGPGVGPGRNGGYNGGDKGGGSKTTVYEPGGGVKPPQPLLQPRPDYTETARRARTEGTVLIQAIIRSDGTVDNFNVLRGLGYGLDESAIRTIGAKWRFKPGTVDGKPVDVMINIEVSFRLY
jgi:periplasmic protein TonB